MGLRYGFGLSAARGRLDLGTYVNQAGPVSRRDERVSCRARGVVLAAGGESAAYREGALSGPGHSWYMP